MFVHVEMEIEKLFKQKSQKTLKTIIVYINFLIIYIFIYTLFILTAETMVNSGDERVIPTL